MARPKGSLLFGILLLAATLAVLITVFSYAYFPVQADETDLAWVGKQVATGRVPYGDFFSFIPPLTLYGLSAWFKAFGATLASLRMLTILWLALVTVLLYLFFLEVRLPVPWAAGAAFSVPALFLPYWPVPSHHWFALGFGLMATLVAWRDHSPPSRWFLAGLLVGLCGMSLQTEGAFFALFLALRLWSGPNQRKGRDGGWALAGMVLPPAAFAGLLALSGSLGWAVYDLVTWPATYYHQAGGFNDVDPFSFIANQVAATIPAHPTPASLAPLLLLGTAITLPLLAFLLPAASPRWLSPGRSFPRRWAASLASLLAVGVLYLRGRSDWTHLVFWTPTLFLILAQEIDWDSERWRPGAVKAWLVVALTIAVLRWPAVWLQAPPLIQDVLATDAAFRHRSIPALVERLPGARQGNLPILYFGRGGSALYFYWAPVPPPLDWIMPPSARYNAPWEYRELARFAVEHRVPYIVIPKSAYGSFTNQPSPLSRLLSTRYQPLGETPWGMVMERKAHAPPNP